MNTSTLLSSSIIGIFSVVALFLFCFACVHVFKLAKIGRTYQKAAAKKASEAKNQPTPPQQKEQKTTQEKPPEQNVGEPVYYIVERKRRAKSSFGEPKRIHFK